MSSSRPPSRRTLLKAAGAAIVSPVFAGCLRDTTKELSPTRTDALQRTNLLAAASLGDAVLVAGERGAIYQSKDGKSWTAGNSGATVTLTSLAVQGVEVLAVGHAGTVLHSADSGMTWARTLDGVQIGRLAEDEVRQRAANGSLSGERLTALKGQAERLVADGPDKPLLDVAYTAEHSATAVGAYGILLQTNSGGESWISRMAAIDNPKGLHLNAIAVSGKSQLIVGEQGLCLRSDDAGASYQRVALPGVASMFSAAWSSQGEVWCGGLNGRLLRSRNRGQSFEAVDIGVAESITAIAALGDGRLVFGHVTGRLTVLEPQSLRHRSLNWADMPLLSDLAARGDSTLIGVGARGPRSFAITDLSL